MPFSVSLNNQQNTKEPIEYVYFDDAQGNFSFIIFSFKARALKRSRHRRNFSPYKRRKLQPNGKYQKETWLG